MQVVITGGAGMIGKKLVREILKRGEIAGPDGALARVDRVTVVDVAGGGELPADPRVSFTEAQVFDAAAMGRIISGDVASVFHLAAVVSAGAEADFDLGYRVNLDGTRIVLEACRVLPVPPRVVFSSSVAVYGGEMPPVIEDTTPLTPQTSYGAQKAMGELLVADYSRKGYVDGRSLRLPTIVVRPGLPNLAASTFASSIIREPLQGKEAICPVEPSIRMPLLSPRRVVEAFLKSHDLPASAWGMNRTLMLPSLDVTVREMAEGLKRVAGTEAYNRIKWQIDPKIQKIVSGWPGRLNAVRAGKMGFAGDESVDALIEAFIADDLAPNRS